MAQEMEALKPCPLCGESLVLVLDYDGDMYFAHPDTENDCPSGSVAIDPYDAMARAKWNTRAKADPAPSQEPVAWQWRYGNHQDWILVEDDPAYSQWNEAFPGFESRALYTHPQPVPSPPADIAGLVERANTTLIFGSGRGVYDAAGTDLLHEAASALTRIAQERDAANAKIYEQHTAMFDEITNLTQRAEAAEARLSSARDEGLEMAGETAWHWLMDWANDLAATRDSYIEARTTGRHSGRRISEGDAAMYAGQFRERAEAVAGCADEVRTAIRTLKATEGTKP